MVYSFYGYSEISKLLHTKHTYMGAKIFMQLSQYAILPFVEQFKDKNIFALPIDDHVRSGYSHSAVLAKGISRHIKPLYRSLRAKNKVRYSGQKKALRQSQKRNFKLACRGGINAVLIDDIVTTGNTLMEAKKICEQGDINILFAITLADARE
ncbi:MAG: ComF family protein [Sulfurospirillum sp.]